MWTTKLSLNNGVNLFAEREDCPWFILFVFVTCSFHATLKRKIRGWKKLFLCLLEEWPTQNLVYWGWELVVYSQCWSLKSANTLLPDRMVKNQKTDSIKCCQDKLIRKKKTMGTLIHCLCTWKRCSNIERHTICFFCLCLYLPLPHKVEQMPQQLNTLGVCSKKLKTYIHPKICTGNSIKKCKTWKHWAVLQ